MHTYLHFLAKGNKILIGSLGVVWCLLISVTAAIDNLETPELINPDNSSYITSQGPITFTWKQDPQVETYTFFLYDVSTREYIQRASELDPRTICLNNVCSQISGVPFEDGHSYRWYVRSFANGKQSSTVYGTFKYGIYPGIPSPISPQNASTISSQDDVSFVWEESENTTSYDFYIYDRNLKKPVNRKFRIPAEDICLNGVCTIQPEVALEDARNHIWYLRARNDSLTGPLITNYFNLSISEAPSTPQVLSPAQGQTLTSGENVEYSWSQVDGATHYNFLLYDRTVRSMVERKFSLQASEVCQNDVCALTIDSSVLKNSLSHVWYITAVNASGTSGLAYTVFNVDGVDTEAPKITLEGPTSQEIGYQEVYVEFGASARDNIDGDISQDIIIDSSAVNTNEIGTYAVTYSVSDSSGNKTETVREVKVVVLPPKNLRVVDSSTTQITLEWDELSYVEGYNLSKNGEYYTTIKGSNKYVDTDVNPNEIYTYKISAFYNGNYSPSSENVRAIAAIRDVDNNTPTDTSHLPAEIAQDYTLRFNDEFNAGVLDFDRWNTAFIWGPNQTINNEEQYYVDALGDDQNLGMSPFSFSSGSLIITAEKTPEALRSKVNNKSYTSGIITSRDSYNFIYGYAEARVKVPSGQGLWPAFWLLNTYYVDKRPEIDIMEILGHQPTRAYQTYHYFDSSGNLVSTESHVDGGDYSKSYHIYSVKWEPGRIQFYIDGQPYKTINDVNVADQEMYVLANLAVGGNWPKAPDETTEFPAKYEIDWIRVYQK